MFTRTKELDSYINKGIKYIADNILVWGEPVYIDNKFAGYYVDKLTDFLFGEGIKFRQDLINRDHIDRIFDKTINSTYSIYGRRTVFSVEFGSIEQVLVLNLTHDDLVWINV